MTKVGKKLRVIIGDDTGIAKGFFHENEAIQKNESIVIFKAEAKVVKGHIELQEQGRSTKIDISKKEVMEVNEKFDLSKTEWEEGDS